MATAGMTCVNCHGGMLAVGGYYNLTTGKQRTPWLDSPKCQSCHTGDAVSHQGSAIIGTQAYLSTDPAATPIIATNTRFAENANTLYRFSTGGMAGMTCESCHGSTHANGRPGPGLTTTLRPPRSRVMPGRSSSAPPATAPACLAPSTARTACITSMTPTGERRAQWLHRRQ